MKKETVTCDKCGCEVTESNRAHKYMRGPDGNSYEVMVDVKRRHSGILYDLCATCEKGIVEVWLAQWHEAWEQPPPRAKLSPTPEEVTGGVPAEKDLVFSGACYCCGAGFVGRTIGRPVMGKRFGAACPKCGYINEDVSIGHDEATLKGARGAVGE